MTQELNKFVLTDANLSEILNKVMPYIEELQLDNHNEPNAGILYDYKLEEALIGLRKILYYLENKSQQPIPQDINEAEVEKYARLRGWEVAQALLPELQQLRDKVWALEGVAKDQESEIEQQKETIEELKAKLEHYRSETSKVQKFVYERKDIGLPCQPIFDAIKDFIDEQAAEIESLKQENGELELKLRNLYFLYRQQTTSMTDSQIIEDFVKYHKSLKQQTHG